MERILEYREKVTFFLENFLDKKCEQLHPAIRKFVKKVCELEVIGTQKRADPMEVVGYLGVKEEIPEEHLKAMAAVWLTRPVYLIKDDICDGDVEREKRETTWYFLSKIFGEDVGKKIALYVSDFFWSWTFEYVESIEDKKIRKILRSFIPRGMEKVTTGQILDIMHEGKKTSVETFMDMYRLKSSTCPLCRRLVLGGLLGGANNEILRKYSELSEHIGILTMLADDAVDYEKDVQRSAPNIFMFYPKEFAEGIFKEMYERVLKIVYSLPWEDDLKHFVEMRVDKTKKAFYSNLSRI